MQPEFDQTRRFLFEDKPVRGQIVRLSGSFQRALDIHHYPTPVANLLGQAFAAVTLLSATLKFDGNLILQTQSDGFVDPLVAQSDESFHIRGIARYPLEEIIKEPLLGNGHIGITISPEKQSERYQGVVAINKNSLAQSLEDYFRQSEQLTTRIWLFADNGICSGLLLQEMPRDCAEDGEFFQHVTTLADTIQSSEMHTLAFSDILKRLFVEEDVRIFQPKVVSFRCSCTIDKMENAVKTLGRTEADELLQDKQVLDVTCEFCHRTYSFDKVDVERIFSTH